MNKIGSWIVLALTVAVVVLSSLLYKSSLENEYSKKRILKEGEISYINRQVSIDTPISEYKILFEEGAMGDIKKLIKIEYKEDISKMLEDKAKKEIKSKIEFQKINTEESLKLIKEHSDDDWEEINSKLGDITKEKDLDCYKMIKYKDDKKALHDMNVYIYSNSKKIMYVFIYTV